MPGGTNEVRTGVLESPCGTVAERGVSQKGYCERQGLNYGTMGYWVRKLRREQDGGDGERDQALVEIEGGANGATPEGSDGAPIELVVGERLVVRLWPSMRSEHLREVLAALESLR